MRKSRAIRVRELRPDGQRARLPAQAGEPEESGSDDVREEPDGDLGRIPGAFQGGQALTIRPLLVGEEVPQVRERFQRLLSVLDGPSLS